MQPVLVGSTAFIRLSRFRNAVLPAIAVLAGAYASMASAQRQIIFSILAVIILHSVVTIWNDLRDEASDKLNGINRLAAVRAKHGLPVLYGCIFISLCVAGWVVFHLPARINWLLAVFVLLGWLYNDRPLQASRRPIASILILGLSYGLVPFLVGAGLVNLNWKVLLLGFGWLCVRSSLSLLKDYKDAPGDAKAGKKTFLLVYGHSRVARVSFVLAAFGYLACVVVAALLASHSVFAAVTLTLVAAWLLHERHQLFHLQDYPSLNHLFHSLLTYEIVFDGLIVAWLHSS